MTTDPTETMHQGSVLGWNLAFSAGATAASFAWVSPRFAFALALGAALEVVNFRSLYRSCHRIFGLGAEGVSGTGPAVGAFGLRFVLLAAVLFFAIREGLHPVGLVVGLSLIMPAVVVAAWRARPAIDPNAPVQPDDDPDWDTWNPWLAHENAPTDDEEDDIS
ncbi:MAG: hypothetical protein GY723_07890 [bacterium]|nr:hypothetical protein [bacterium]MCP5067531.1 hypothetical protein [bacterium]